MVELDVTLIVQIAIACVVVPLLLSFILYFLWPNVYRFFADKFKCACHCLTYPCTSVLQRCFEEKDDVRKSNRHDPHYLSADRSLIDEPGRQSRSKSERKLRVENPKRREQRDSEEYAAAELKKMTRKAKATRVEKIQKHHSKKKSNGFKYQFREESVTEEVNPYLSSGSSATPFDLENDGKYNLSEDIESGQ